MSGSLDSLSLRDGCAVNFDPKHGVQCNSVHVRNNTTQPFVLDDAGLPLSLTNYGFLKVKEHMQQFFERLGKDYRDNTRVLSQEEFLRRLNEVAVWANTLEQCHEKVPLLFGRVRSVSQFDCHFCDLVIDLRKLCNQMEASYQVKEQKPAANAAAKQ